MLNKPIYRITIKHYLLSVFLLLAVCTSYAQLMNHYWVHNFNSTSSLLGGAVVAGDANNTAIFYNPATIGEMQSGNNLSLAANLFSWNFYNFDNALGDGIDLQTDNFLVQPQFLSYSYKPQQKGLSISIAALTRVKERLEMTYSDSRYVDVLSKPGEEKYNTSYNFRNDFSDSWIGVAISHKISPKFSYGISLFGSGATLNYRFNYSVTAINSGDTLGEFQLSRIAEGSYSEFVKFNDYRLIAKLGITYKVQNWRFGLTFTSPSWRLFSSGKRAQRIDQQINISRDEMPAGVSDYVIFDGQEKSQLSTNFKMPFSAGAGFIYNFKSKGQKVYFSAEFFGGLKGYKMVDAEVNPDITSNTVYDTLSNKDWTSFVYAANPVINISVGYSWTLKNDLVFLNALRTDFSAVNNLKLDNYENYNSIKTTSYNIYHYSGGVEFSFKNNRFIAGADLAFGYQKNLRQIANFSDPEEYNESSGRALQGSIENNMDMYYFGFSIYLGATLNFARKEPGTKK